MRPARPDGVDCFAATAPGHAPMANNIPNRPKLSRRVHLGVSEEMGGELEGVGMLQVMQKIGWQQVTRWVAWASAAALNSVQH